MSFIQLSVAYNYCIRHAIKLPRVKLLTVSLIHMTEDIPLGESSITYIDTVFIYYSN